ncbi:dihydrofolate reductase family protein [Planococcus maitriensis]|uniref:Dihydrofolate reductase n=1 Tax=Planococcus maitriensis TaxID=221799 RepID=A0A365K500_9BACL|nr:dihydrofolate reductase family protein [Planococcus maitriensis]RAZ67717.1 dihydrofolate reductase [Planococcus maitriensis]
MGGRKVVCYIAQSLDGYIADKEETLEWLLDVEMDGDAGYGRFIETVDTILLGRRTYEWVIAHESGKFPYADLRSYVFTSHPKEDEGQIAFTSEDPASVLKKLKQQPGGTIWPVGGSLLLENLLQEDLIDEFVISIAPVTLGDGIPLFQKAQRRLDFTLERVGKDGQIAQLHYTRRRI